MPFSQTSQNLGQKCHFAQTFQDLGHFPQTVMGVEKQHLSSHKHLKDHTNSAPMPPDCHQKERQKQYSISPQFLC